MCSSFFFLCFFFFFFFFFFFCEPNFSAFIVLAPMRKSEWRFQSHSGSTHRRNYVFLSLDFRPILLRVTIKIRAYHHEAVSCFPVHRFLQHKHICTRGGGGGESSPGRRALFFKFFFFMRESEKKKEIVQKIYNQTGQKGESSERERTREQREKKRKVTRAPKNWTVPSSSTASPLLPSEVPSSEMPKSVAHNRHHKHNPTQTPWKFPSKIFSFLLFILSSSSPLLRSLPPVFR